MSIDLNNQPICAALIVSLVCYATFASADICEGPSGGTGGTWSDDEGVSQMLSTGQLPVQILVRTGSYLDHIQFVYSSTLSGTAHGGSGGTEKDINFRASEVITQFTGTYGSYVNTISLQTIIISGSNKGVTNTITRGNNPGPASFFYAAPPGFYISGFCGRNGDYIDALGVLIRPLQ
jgi:hypothetical protein